jgi:hypothetical protein
MSSLQLTRLVMAGVLLSALSLALALTSREGHAIAKTQQEERKLENLIPKHVPLGIKIRKEKEKEFKDLSNERWARDLEVEVTNTGDKPIYEFYLNLVLDIKDSSGQKLVAPIYYGRAELGDHRVRATKDDVPLKPGESCILKIHPGQLSAWDTIRRQDSWPHPKKVSVEFQLLSFGDGSGLMGPDAAPVPPRKPGEMPNLTRLRAYARALDEFILGRISGGISWLSIADLNGCFR